jgi:hypothetical protein
MSAPDHLLINPMAAPLKQLQVLPQAEHILQIQVLFVLEHLLFNQIPVEFKPSLVLKIVLAPHLLGLQPFLLFAPDHPSPNPMAAPLKQLQVLPQAEHILQIQVLFAQAHPFLKQMLVLLKLESVLKFAALQPPGLQLPLQSVLAQM